MILTIIKNLQLYFIAFICGAVSMALEVTVGRLLVFDYGSGTEVWGAIIGIMLVGLSLGYYLGGREADRKPEESFLGLFIASAGLWISFIPLFQSFLSASLIFESVLLLIIPSILLGAVTPFVIKLKIKKVEKLGTEAGSLYAVATLGSVFGTFLAAFGLIVWFPLHTIFVSLGICLLLLSIILIHKKNLYVIAAVIAITGAFFLVSLYSPPEGKGKVLFSKQSLYGKVVITKDDDIVSMYIDDGVMGQMSASDRYKTLPAWSYVDAFEIIAREKEANDILNLGVGPGLVASRLSEKYGMNVDAVDINEDVLEASKKYFGLGSSEKVSVYTDDARLFLRKTEKLYDVIEMDAFKYDKGAYIIPPQLTTMEFFREVKGHLKKGGIFAIMVIDYPEKFLASELRTLKKVFPNIYTFNCSSLYIFAASDNVIDLDAVTKESICVKAANVSNDGVIFTDEHVPLSG